MQKSFNLIPPVIILVYLSVQILKYCRKMIKQARYIVSHSEEIDMSAISGTGCLIIGDHPFANSYGSVVGSKEYRGRWALVVNLKDKPGTYCYVFDNRNLYFL